MRFLNQRSTPGPASMLIVRHLIISPRLAAHRNGYSSGPATGTVGLGSSTSFLRLPYRLVVTPLDVYCHRNALRHIVARHLDPAPSNTPCCPTCCIGPHCFPTSSHFCTCRRRRQLRPRPRLPNPSFALPTTFHVGRSLGVLSGVLWRFFTLHHPRNCRRMGLLNRSTFTRMCDVILFSRPRFPTCFHFAIPRCSSICFDSHRSQQTAAQTARQTRLLSRVFLYPDQLLSASAHCLAVKNAWHAKA